MLVMHLVGELDFALVLLHGKIERFTRIEQASLNISPLVHKSRVQIPKDHQIFFLSNAIINSIVDRFDMIKVRVRYKLGLLSQK